MATAKNCAIMCRADHSQYLARHGGVLSPGSKCRGHRVVVWGGGQIALLTTAAPQR